MEPMTIATLFGLAGLGVVVWLFYKTFNKKSAPSGSAVRDGRDEPKREQF